MLQLLGNVVKRSTTLPPKQLQQHQEYGKKWDVEVLWCKRKAPAAAAHSEALSHSQGRDAKVLEDRGQQSQPYSGKERGGENSSPIQMGIHQGNAAVRGTTGGQSVK